MGESYGQKQAKKYTGKQVNTLKGAEADMLQNPLFLLGQKLAQQVGENPLTLTPELVAQIKGANTGIAYDDYRGQVGQGLEQAGAVGAYRDGSTRQFERNMAADLANRVGTMNNQVDIAAAQQRYPDLINANSLLSGNLNQRYAFDRDIANAYGGAAVNPAWGQPTATQSALGGLGALGGSLIPKI